MERDRLQISLPGETRFLPLAVSFAKQAGLAFGLGEEQSCSLSLAAEEIFLYISRLSGIHRELTIECESAFFYVDLGFIFQTGAINLRALNLAPRASLDKDASIEEMPLLVASRLADRFQFKHLDQGRVRLSIIKEKVYPKHRPVEPRPVEAGETHIIRSPEYEEAKIMAAWIVDRYPVQSRPGYFLYPGKIADMMKGGYLQGAAAVAPNGQITGGIFWRMDQKRTVEFFGPYLFVPRPNSSLAEDLMEHCLNALARSSVLGVITRYASPDLPAGHFQNLGNYTIHDSDNTPVTMTAFYRQMHEDPGCRVWSHPDLLEFLESQYQRLVLPREVVTSLDEGESSDEYSVISTDFHRTLGAVTMRPVVIGKDIKENLVAHMALFKKEKIRDVFFELDLDLAPHSRFTPHLLELGFKPKILMPYTGPGDLVILQLESRQ